MSIMQRAPLAVQMYTLRSLTLPLDEVLAAVADAGYTGIETFGPLSPPAEEMAALLARHGLQVVSAHVSLEMLENDLATVIAWHRGVGNSTLAVPWLHPDARPTSAAGWREFGARIDRLGARCRAEGMRLLYHNHDFEFASYEGKLAEDWLLGECSPENVGVELDIAWVVRAGVDPVDVLTRYSGRVPRVHAKDAARPGENAAEMGMADVGDGIVDWATVLPAAHAAGVEWVVVEHDMPLDPLKTIRRGAAFLAERWGG